MILDSSALIALERGQLTGSQSVAGDADVAIAAVTAAELLVGVELANDEHRERRAELVAAILRLVDVIAFDLPIARDHALLLAHVRRSGRPRGAHDLQIAATAKATGRTIITTDRTAFADLPGVTHRLL